MANMTEVTVEFSQLYLEMLGIALEPIHTMHTKLSARHTQSIEFVALLPSTPWQSTSIDGATLDRCIFKEPISKPRYFIAQWNWDRLKN